MTLYVQLQFNLPHLHYPRDSHFDDSSTKNFGIYPNVQKMCYMLRFGTTTMTPLLEKFNTQQGSAATEDLKKQTFFIL